MKMAQNMDYLLNLDLHKNGDGIINHHHYRGELWKYKNWNVFVPCFHYEDVLILIKTHCLLLYLIIIKDNNNTISRWLYWSYRMKHLPTDPYHLVIANEMTIIKVVRFPTKTCIIPSTYFPGTQINSTFDKRFTISANISSQYFLETFDDHLVHC